VILNRLILRKRVFYQPHTYLKPAHAPLLNAFFDGIVLLSKRNQLLIKEKLLHAKTVVIYNPIPVILAARDPKAKPVYDFLFVGRDVPCKRMGMFLSAMATLRAKGCLVTTGFSDEGNRIAAERLAHDGKLDIRLGLSLESIHKTYGKSKIFVFPSNAEEGFGIVVLEAAHFGLEILAEDNPKNRELFGHEISYFSGQKELASKMAKLVSKSRLRKYSFLARYSPASVAKGYASLSLQAPSGSAL
jgi:glycosyltransferase involved in cell wall biosynthesis